MLQKVKNALRERGLGGKSVEDLIVHLNRELGPVVRETRQRVNDMVDVVNAIVGSGGTVPPPAIEPGPVGAFLRTLAGPVTAWKTLVELAALDPTGGADGDVITRVAGTAAWATPASSGATPIARHDTTFSPVGLWQFDGSMADTSGNGFDLTVFFGTERYTDIFPGIRGFAFDANTTLYRNALDAALRISGDITVEMLLELSQNGSNGYDANGPLIEHGIQSAGEANNELYRIETVTRYLPSFRQEHDAGGATTSFASTYRLPVCGVFHYAVTRSSNTIQHYLNGRTLGGSGSVTAATGGSTGKLHVGGNSSNPGGVCTMASLKIVGSALTADNIKAEFNRTLGPHYGSLA